jgi:poly-gamma-glutamate synthesis protein (capsule biosynthesis protein)
MPGLTQTLDALDTAGLRHAGTARTPPESQTPVIYDVRGVRVGHLAATYGLNGLPVPRDAPWSVNLLDPAAILGGARGLRAAGAEVVVVSLHWGVEYRAAPTAEQEAIAEQLLASGEIDAIVGHHAHVVQPVARLHDRVVVYGLGNLLSGQSQPERRDGVVVTLRFAEEDAARHPTPGRFRVREVVATPTLVTRPDYRVAAIPELLADPALDAATRAQLEASRARTAATLGPEAVTR